LSYSLSVVVPMYNEEAGAESAVKSLLKTLSGLSEDFEIIIVESGSTDRTADIADLLAHQDPSVRVIHQINREGLGSAIRLGFANARKDFVLYIDGDEPFDVTEISRALPLLGPETAVIGYRIGERESLKRKILSRTYNWIVQLLFHLDVRDVNFSMKIVPRAMLRRLKLRANGCFYDAELLAELRKASVGIVEVGFEFTPRSSGSSSLDRAGVVLDIVGEMLAYYLGSWMFRRHPRRGADS